MRLSDLQTKEIINMDDGKRMGVIIDVNVDPTTGRIKSFLLQENKNVRKMFSSREEYEVKWEQIVKVGEDIILVNTK